MTCQSSFRQGSYYAVAFKGALFNRLIHSFEALALVPFNINPHFIDTDENSKHQGETRQDRIEEFLEQNEQIVLAMREGSALLVDGDKGRILGHLPAILFVR